MSRKQSGGKWVAKSEKGAAEAGDGIRSRSATAATDADGTSVDVITSPLLLSPSLGAKFEKIFLLRIFQKSRTANRPGLAPATDEHEDADEPIRLIEREAEEEVEDPKPGEKRAARIARKAERERKKSESLPYMEASPYPGQYAADGGPLTSLSLEPLKLALSQELQAGGEVAAPDNALMTYLAGMQYNAPPMPAGADGAQPGFTTVMLRNIPNRYTRDMLAERLDQNLKGKYDFIYLPIDFSSKCNVGYAFINFTSPAHCMKFIEEFNGVKTKQCLPGFSSNKVCEVTFARVQGRDANMENLRDEKFIEKLTERPEWQPVFYDEEGVAIPFSKTLERASGSRKNSRNDSMKSPPISPNMGPQKAPGGGYPSSPYGGPAAPPMMFNMPAQAGPLSSMLPTAGPWTTVMLRFIPSSYTRELLLDRLNRRFKGSFDFLYLPPKTEEGPEPCTENKGYAFINFRSHHFAAYFASLFHRVKAEICLPGFASSKTVEVSQARLHTVQKQLETFRERQQQEVTEASWHPLLFDLQGNPMPFPTGKLSSKAPNFVPTMNLPPGERQEAAVRIQIEFYFSLDNLCKDLYLRSFMDEEGWTPLDTIAQFPKVKKFGATMADIAKAVKPSELIEVDATELKVRLKDEESRKKFSKVPEDMRKSVAAGAKDASPEKA